MTDLRTAVVALKRTQYSPLYVDIGDVLDLIPEGSVLVTEAELDAALDALLDAPHPDLAAAILARIREAPRG